MARQIGSALGVAVTVALIGTGTGALDSFDRAWIFVAASSGAAALVAGVAGRDA